MGAGRDLTMFRELQETDPEELVEAMLAADSRWVADPHAFYAALRRKAPVYWSAGANAWVVSGYDDVRTVLRHRGTSNATVNLDPRVARSPMLQRFETIMIYLDPPEHTRNRKVTRSRFTRQNVESQRPQIERLVERALAEACEARSVDFIEDVCAPVSVGAMCHMLGVPPEDHHLFAEWNSTLVASFWPGVPDELLERGDAAMVSLVDYCRALMAERAAVPQDDLATVVVAARSGDGAIGEDEALAVLVMLVMAGIETSANLIANGTIALVEHPGEMTKLRDRPELMRNAVEEFVRYNGLAQIAFPRFTTDDSLNLRDGRVAIAEGEKILLLWPAADRDPGHFERPDELDVERANASDCLGWGHGAHLCLGANLARLTSSIALTRLLERVDEIEVVSDPIPWQYTGNVRQLFHLGVAVVPR